LVEAFCFLLAMKIKYFTWQYTIIASILQVVK